MAETTTDHDEEPSARPWVEVVDGQSNISGGTVAEALGCYLPQGVDGCGFEAQLESMLKAISRFSMTSESGYDFHREGAGLAIAIVTDELDCSANEAQQSQVFDRNLSEAEKVFWADPTSSVPTSAICFNAGVACQGGGSVYDGCDSADYAIDGSAATNPEDNAVMRPVARYRELLQGIEDSDAMGGARDVVFTLIGGVPVGYESGTALVYQESADPIFQTSFGIDAGCTVNSATSSGYGIPPVRMRELAESFDLDDGEKNITSVCADSYSPGLAGFAKEILSLTQ